MPTDLSTLRLAEEAALHAHLEEIFNAKVVGSLLDSMDARGGDRSLTLMLKENYLPITEALSPKLFGLCQQSLKALDYTGKQVEFFLSNTPEINASSIYTAEHVPSHYIVLNAGLVELLNDAELRYVIGHELAHLIFAHSRFSRVMHVVYPDPGRMPTYLQRRLSVWTKLNEMGSDRLGLIAAGDFESAVRAILKISCGVGLTYFEAGLDAYLGLVDQVLKELGEENAASFQSHPGSPLRAKALQLFNQSLTFQSIQKGEPVPEDPELTKAMGELTRLMKYTPTSDREAAELDFLAAAGLMLLGADGNADPREVNQLVNLLSRHSYYPHEHVHQLQEAQKTVETMQASAAFIHEHYGEECSGLMAALLPIILRDGVLNEEEVSLFFSIATKEMKLTPFEARNMILEGLRTHFAPMA